MGTATAALATQAVGLVQPAATADSAFIINYVFANCFTIWKLLKHTGNRWTPAETPDSACFIVTIQMNSNALTFLNGIY
jgi:hypothetical protein